MVTTNFVPKLYGYWRSTASWRVRWAFEIKKFKYEYVPVNILAGETQQPVHLARNSLGLLPLFEPDSGVFIAESLAIIAWLEESTNSATSLYPQDLILRAKTRALCEMINAETAPLQTPRAQKKHSDDPTERTAWAAHFIREGLRGYTSMCAELRGVYSVGDQVTAADLCVVPQIYNALRFGVDAKNEFPELWAIYERCMALDECKLAAPDAQVDAVR